MPTKPKIPENADDKEQSERFIETVREREADETGKAIESVFRAITRKSDSTDRKKNSQ